MEYGATVTNTGGHCMVAGIATKAGYLEISQECVAIMATPSGFWSGADDDENDPLAYVMFDDVTADDGWLSTPWAIASTDDALRAIMSAVNYSADLHDTMSDDRPDDADELAMAHGACNDGVAWALQFLSIDECHDGECALDGHGYATCTNRIGVN
jgi:hypothetical protein